MVREQDFNPVEPVIWVIDYLGAEEVVFCAVAEGRPWKHSLGSDAAGWLSFSGTLTDFPSAAAARVPGEISHYRFGFGRLYFWLCRFLLHIF